MVKSDLDWWLTLAQEDLSTLHSRTERRLMSELDHMLNDPTETDAWNAPKIKPGDFIFVITHLNEALNKLKKGGRVEATYVVHETLHCSPWEEFGKDVVGKSEHWIGTENLKETCLALFLRSWRLANINPEQIKNCSTCEKIFVQKGKREKLYCSTQCRNKAHKQKQEDKDGS